MNDSIIDQLGGASRVAADLNLDRNRVNNWRERGVPWRFRLAVLKLAKSRKIKVPEDFLGAF